MFEKYGVVSCVRTARKMIFISNLLYTEVVPVFRKYFLKYVLKYVRKFVRNLFNINEFQRGYQDMKTSIVTRPVIKLNLFNAPSK